MEAVLSRLATMNVAELERVHASRESSVLEAAVAATLIRCIQRGEVNGLTVVLDRLFGRVPMTAQNVNIGMTYADALKAAREVPVGELSERLRLAREAGKIE